MENFAAYLSDMDGKNSFSHTVKVFNEDELNEKFYKILLVMFFECSQQFKQGYCERYDDLRSVLGTMKIPFALVEDYKILFTPLFKSTENAKPPTPEQEGDLKLQIFNLLKYANPKDVTFENELNEKLNCLISRHPEDVEVIFDIQEQYDQYKGHKISTQKFQENCH